MLHHITPANRDHLPQTRFPMKTLPVFITLLLTTVVSLSSAGLQWEEREIERIVTPDATEAVFLFPFTNTGDQAITVTAIKTGCSCTIAELENRRFEPGTGDAIRVRLELTPTGGRKKTVFVYTDDGKTTMLNISAQKSGYLVVEEPDLIWRQGDAAAERRITIRVAANSPVHPETLRVTADAAAVASRLETVADGSAWQLYLRPQDTQTQGRHTLTVDSGIGDEYGGILRFEVWILPALAPAAD